MSRFTLASLDPTTQNWVLGVYSGAEPYFPMPATLEWQEIHAVLYWKQFDAQRRELERVWEPRFEAILTKAGQRACRALQESGNAEAAQRTVGSALIPPLRKAMEDCTLETERIFLGRLKDSTSFKADDEDWQVRDPRDVPEMLSWNATTLGSKITKIDEATRQRIRQLVDRGIREGASITQMVDRLAQDFAFSRFRSYLIARTEIISASNAATHFGVGGNFPKTAVLKDWLATGDRRTRPTHLKAGMTQKSIPFRKPFQVGGSELMFPGDGSLGAPPREIIQCRCAATYVVDRSRLGGTLPPPPPPPAPAPAPLPAVPKPAPPRPTKPKPKKVTPKDVAKARQALPQSVAREASRLEAEIDTLWNKAKMATGQTLSSIETEITGLIHKRSQLDNAARQVMDMIKGLGEQNSNLLLGMKYQSAGRRLRGPAEEAAAWLRDITTKISARPLTVSVTSEAGVTRSYAKPWKRTIYMGTQEVRIFVHEIGHVLEERVPALKKAMGKLYAKRTAGEATVPLKQLFPYSNYEPGEITRKDQWLHPYQGKVYSAGLTEMTSMALQYLYEDPVRLMRQDPELFDVLVSALRSAKP